MLKAHRKLQAEERLLLGPTWKDTLGLVFVSEIGVPIHASCIIAHFKNTLAAAQLPYIRFHDLRHTAATLMLAGGEPLVTVSKILGHSSPAIDFGGQNEAHDSHYYSQAAKMDTKTRYRKQRDTAF